MEAGRQSRTLKLLEDLGLAYVSVDEPQGFPSSTPPVVACTSELAVHVLMNNCYRDYAVRNARQLAGLLAQPLLSAR